MLQCPNCGGNLKFSPSAQKMNCDHCSSQFDPYLFDSKTQDAKEKELYDVTIFTCPQCGGEIISTDNTAAGFCSFCGASTILYSRISKERRPSYLIPFKKTKEDCKKAYKTLMKRAIFAPKELKDEKCIDSFRGIYMPYWSYEIVQEGSFHLPGEKQNRVGDYIITKYFELTGDVDSWYDGFYYDASSAFDDQISEKLAPFQIKEQMKFTPAFLSGFYADIADVSEKLYENEAKEKIHKENLARIRQTPTFAPYHIKTTGSKAVIPEVYVRSVSRTMFPVWFLSYQKKGRVIYATVNGQTGKIVADLPIDPKKYMIGSLLLSIPLFFLFNWTLVLTPSLLTVVNAVLAVLTLFLYGTESNQIVKKELHLEDQGYNWVQNQNRNEQATSQETQSRKGKEKPKIGGYFSGAVAFLISVALLVLRPVSDLYYYGGAIFSLFAIAYTIVSIIRSYNILSTHKLPQFERQGGDDRA